jgi:ABC-type polar amino acid transport system ATPase subunit
MSPTTTEGPVLRLNSIHKSFGAHHVLRGVDLEITRGETICLIGPSGSGKSTLLRCCNLLELPESGSVRLGDTVYYDNGAATSGLKPLRTGTAMVFQDFQLFAHLTALENVALAPRIVRKLGRKQAQAEAELLLARVGLAEFAGHRPSQLSGGQQQRVSIARALAMQPQVLLFDEPTSALDPETVNEVLKIMVDLAETGVTMLVVTHEMRFAREAASRILVLEAGEIVEQGPADVIFSRPSHPTTRRFLSSLGILDDAPAEAVVS